MEDIKRKNGFEILQTITDENFYDIVLKLMETEFSKEKIEEFKNLFNKSNLNGFQLKLFLIRLSLNNLYMYFNWFSIYRRYEEKEVLSDFIKEVFGDFKIGKEKPYYQLVNGERKCVGSFPIIICNSENAPACNQNENEISMGDLRICALAQLRGNIIEKALKSLIKEIENNNNNNININEYSIKDELCNIFNIMLRQQSIYSSEVSPIKFDGGRFYYTNRNIANNGRNLSIISDDGMYLGATMPYTDCNLKYTAQYNTPNISFEEACIEYGFDKTMILLNKVKDKIIDLTQRQEKNKTEGNPKK